MKWPGILIGPLAGLLLIATIRSCRYDWNPHYLSNEAVEIDSIIYNPDSSAAVVNYTLDIGARDFSEYQTLLLKPDFQKDLSKFLLPTEYTAPKWRGNDSLEAVFDEYAGCKIAGL